MPFLNNRYAGAAGGAVGYAEAAGGTRDRGWGRRRDGFPPEASQVSGRYAVNMRTHICPHIICIYAVNMRTHMSALLPRMCPHISYIFQLDI